MAKVKFSALVSEMRNKLNGSVFSKNRGGNYLRNKVTPVNPQTVHQTDVRSRFGTNAATFRTLTQSQIAAWNSASANFPVIDIFGDTKFLSGLQLYVRLNTNLQLIGESVISSPPNPGLAPTPGLIGFTADIGAGDFAMTFTEAVQIAGNSLLVYATSPMSPGKSFAKNLFRLLGEFPIASNEVDIQTAYVARFGSPAVGQKVMVRAAYVNNTTGQAGVPIELSALVVST